MAKILESFSFKNSTARGPGSKHPWKQWLDGQIHAITAEDWGSAKPQTIQMMLRKQGRKVGKGMRMEWDKETETLVFQAYDATPEQAQAWKDQELAAKAKAKETGEDLENEENGDTEPDATEPNDENEEPEPENEENEEPEQEAPKETTKQRKARERAERNQKH